MALWPSTGQKAAQIRVPGAIKIFHGYGIRGKIDRRLATDSEADCDCVRRGNKSAATVEAARENRAINSGYKAVLPDGPQRFLRSMQFHRFLQITDGVPTPLAKHTAGVSQCNPDADIYVHLARLNSNFEGT